MKLKDRLKSITPVGFDAAGEIRIFGFGTPLCTLFSLEFFIKLNNEIGNLYFINGKTKYLDPKAVMPSFREVLGGSLLPFAALFLVLLSYIFLHYEYHKRGSKSIYLMKRLPQKNELAKRCITLPLILSLTVLILAAILFCIFYFVYFIKTPEGLIAVF